MNGDPEDDPSKGYKGEDGPGGTKRRGPRTTIKAKQLEILKLAFDQVRMKKTKTNAKANTNTTIKAKQLEILKLAFDEVRNKDLTLP